MRNARLVLPLICLLTAVLPRVVAGVELYVDGAIDEAGPCSPNGCGGLGDGAASVAIVPPGDIVIGGSFRELGEVASAGVVKLSGADGSEVWRNIPITVPPQYTQMDPFFPQGQCHLGGVGLLEATASGDLIGAGVCKVFPAPASHIIVRYSGATGAPVWTYGPDFLSGAAALALHGGSVLALFHSGATGRVVALDEITGAEIWSKSLASVGLSSAGFFAIGSTGDVFVVGVGSGLEKVVRLAAGNGALQWTYTLTSPGGPGEGNGLGPIALTASDDVVVGGKIRALDGIGELAVLKLAAASGSELWRYTARGTTDWPGPDNGGGALAIDASGDVYASGTLSNLSSGPSAFDNDAVVVRLTAGLGTEVWRREFTGTSPPAGDGVEGIRLDSTGSPVVLLRLWAAQFPSGQRADPVMTKLNPSTGSTVWSRRPTDTTGGAFLANANAENWVSVGSLTIDSADIITAVGSIFRQVQVNTDYDAFIWRLFPNGSATPCYDGDVDAGEQCDDGNRTNGDGCDNNCTLPACGNGIAAGAEACDDGNASEGDGCDSNCTFSVCGNAIAGGAEECDDGNAINGDTCDNNCTLPACGNGIAAGAEACDDGNLVNGDSCDTNCTVPACGNGIAAGAEACDDGNPTNGDGCESDCTLLGCGNGSVGGGEICDDNNVVSGDGCDANCRPTACGNGLVTAGEICDDGNLVSGDGCDDNCRPTACGNNVVTAGETCDDGNAVSGDGCDANCAPTGCGNGVRTTGEQCDDGNALDGDGCQVNCTFTPFTVAESVGPNETVTTDVIGGATAAYPAQASVTTPTGGDVSISKLPSQAPQQNGYATLGMVFHIEAPAATSAADPLHIQFVLDASVIPLGLAAAEVAVFKDGGLVPDCTGPSGQASPDPCVALREVLATDDVRVVVLTTTASTWAAAVRTHDTVVRALKPLALKLTAAGISKELKVTVLNGDSKDEVPGHAIALAASTDCPGGTVTEPDFDGDTGGPQPTVTLAGGKKAKAVVVLAVAAPAVNGINAKAPVRCALTFAASTVGVSDADDPTQANNTVTIDVDLYDGSDAGVATSHETVMGLLKPVKIKIADGGGTVAKDIKGSTINADILPAPEVGGHLVTVTASDGTCPPGTISVVDADSTTGGIQTDDVVGGGAKGKPVISLSIDPAAFKAAGPKSPARCIALISATGPGGEVDTRNDTARLVIDVFDKNDE